MSVLGVGVPTQGVVGGGRGSKYSVGPCIAPWYTVWPWYGGP